MPMLKRSRTEVTIETDERLFIRRRGRWANASCSECVGPATLVALEEAVALAGVSSRAIHRWVETGEIHFAETADGFLLVCLDALIRVSRSRQTYTDHLLKGE